MSVTVKYRLPESLRARLKQPLGTLYNKQEFLNYIKETSTKLVSVGDLVTLSLFCIIDDHTRRHDIDSTKKKKIHRYGKKEITVQNPAGFITEELWNTIQRLFKSNTTDVIVLVEGEEDLAALPAILFAPSDVTIIYGMPDKGVVVVPATEHHKQKVKDIIDKM